MRVVAVLCAVFAVAVAVNTCTGISAFSMFPDPNTACDMVAVAMSTGGTTDLGTACFRWSNTGSDLYYHIEANVAGGVTAAHLHDGNPMTGSGNVLVNLNVTTASASATTYIGCIANVDGLATSSMIDKMQYSSLSNYIKSGRTYLNIHSVAASAGACRGQTVWSPQLMAAEATGMGAGTGSMANAVGVSSLAGGAVQYQAVNSMTFDGYGPCTAAHIHTGTSTTQGGTVQVVISGTTFIAAAGMLTPLTATNLGAFPNDTAGQYPAGNTAGLPPNAGYWNYHSAANASGEIRGENMLLRPQVVPAPLARTWKYVALLNAGNEQESNSASTATTGFGIFVAAEMSNGTGYYLNYILMTNPDSGDFSAGHIHIGNAQTNGNVLTPINYPGSANGWRYASGTAFIGATTTDPNYVALTTNGLYVNLHTTTNTAGAIRGQIAYTASNVHAAVLSGNAQSIATAGVNSGTGSPWDGIGVFVGAHTGADYTETAGTSMYYLVHNIPSANVTAQHIHGPITTGTTAGVLTAITAGSYGPQVFQGTYTETATDATNMGTDGTFYFNVHTAINPNGELRGNFMKGQCGVSATTCFNPMAIPYGTATSTTTMGMTSSSTAPATSTTGAASSVVASFASVVIAALIAVLLA